MLMKLRPEDPPVPKHGYLDNENVDGSIVYSYDILDVFDIQDGYTDVATSTKA